jgi:hypothetical protein
MLEKMMAMAQVIKNLSVENEQLKETRKRNRYPNLSKNVILEKLYFLYIFCFFSKNNQLTKIPPINEYKFKVTKDKVVVLVFSFKYLTIVKN